MKTETVPIADLSEDPSNARSHPERNIEAIKASLRKWKQQKPIVVGRDNVVVAGNGTLRAAKELGWEEINIVRTDLVGADATGFAIADNKIALTAEWEDETLNALISGLHEEGDLDPTPLGFTQEEIDQMLASAGLSGTGDGGVEDPGAEEPPEKATSKLGDLWVMGNHRLLCGDSTKAEDVERLLAGAKARLFATDPPYGVDYSKTKDGIRRSGFKDHQAQWGDIKGDDLEGEKLQEFLEDVFTAWLPNLQSAAWYLWHAHLAQGFFAAAAAAAAADVLLHRQVIWKKPGFVLTRSGMYHWAHEPAFYGWVRGSQPEWYGPKNQTSVWEVGRDEDRGYHPTQKPTELFEIPMRNHLKEGEVCAEPFCGSGSQIIAAEKCRVRCCAMELEPRYVDAALRRWEKATGGQAVLDGSQGATFADVAAERA
jgi:DNA modification methylase